MIQESLEFGSSEDFEMITKLENSKLHQVQKYRKNSKNGYSGRNSKSFGKQPGSKHINLMKSFRCYLVTVAVEIGMN